MAFPDAFSKATELGDVGRTTTCLFIGGSANGRHISVLDGTTCIRVPKVNCGGEQDSVFGYDEYRHEQLASPTQRYSVFIEKGLTLDTAMQALINNYGRLIATPPELE